MLWSLTNEDVAAAQLGDATAVGRLCDQTLPTCCRIAYSLAGRVDVGQKIGKELTQQLAGALPKFRDADEATRWLVHHTILLKRRFAKPFTANQDVLLMDVGGPDVVQYQAMIGALRKLTPQQQEAFVLTHAQRWNTRMCAVAMDCSNTAVETHLEGADREIRPLLGEHFGPLTAFLSQIHRSMPVDIPAAPTIIAAKIKARRGWRAAVRVSGWVLIVVVILAVAAAAIFVLPNLEI